MPLLRTFSPVEGESPIGYYRRLAHSNRFESWRDLASAADVSLSRTGLLGRPDHVAQALGLDASWARTASQTEATLRHLQRFLRGSFDAVCPDCLGESPHLHAAWEHVYSTACAKHQRLLVDRCDRCNARLSINRTNICVCECGRDLRHIARLDASSDQAWLSSVIDGTGKCRISPQVGKVDLLAFTHLVRVICSQPVLGDASPRRNAAEPKTVDEAIELLRPLKTLFSDWPIGFQAHVQQRLTHAPAGARTLNTALGSWFKLLKKYSLHSKNHLFLDVVMDVAARSFPGLIGLDAAGLRGIHVDKPLLVKEVAFRLGVSRDFIVACIDQKLIPAQLRKFGERRLMYQVLESDVRRLEASRAQWCDLPAAQKQLDVPESVLNSLVSVQALETDPNWRKDIRKGGPVSVASIETLVNNIRSAAHSEVVGTDDTLISLHKLTSRRFSDKSALQRAISAIVRGELHGVGKLPSSGIGGIQFRMDDIRDYFGTPILEAGLSLDQLCTLTGWKHETVSNWIKEGYLQAQSIMLRGQPCRVVLPADLMRFQREYIPLADLAKSLGSRSSSVSRQLTGIPIFGAKELPNGLRRGGLIRLHDLACAALAGVKTTTDSDA